MRRRRLTVGRLLALDHPGFATARVDAQVVGVLGHEPVLGLVVGDVVGHELVDGLGHVRQQVGERLHLLDRRVDDGVERPVDQVRDEGRERDRVEGLAGDPGEEPHRAAVELVGRRWRRRWRWRGAGSGPGQRSLEPGGARRWEADGCRVLPDDSSRRRRGVDRDLPEAGGLRELLLDQGGSVARDLVEVVLEPAPGALVQLVVGRGGPKEGPDLGPDEILDGGRRGDRSAWQDRVRTSEGGDRGGTWLGHRVTSVSARRVPGWEWAGPAGEPRPRAVSVGVGVGVGAGVAGGVA